MKRRFILIFFPLTYYLGQVDALKDWDLNRKHVPCGVQKEVSYCEEIDRLINFKNEFNFDKIYDKIEQVHEMYKDEAKGREYRENEDFTSLSCTQLQGMAAENKLDEELKIFQNDKSTLVSEECKESCEYTRTYRTEVPIYPCKKIKVEKLNGEIEYLKIKEVNVNQNFEVLDYFSPWKTGRVSEKMSCGDQLCTANIDKLNEDQCEEGCLEQLGCSSESWDDDICTKLVKQHLLVCNSQDWAVVWNSYGKYNCEIQNENCYNFWRSVYGLEDRQIMHYDFIYDGIMPWWGALLKMKDKTREMKIDLIRNGETIEIPIFGNSKIHKDYKDKIEFDIDWTKEDKYDNVLVLFEDRDQGDMATVVYNIDDSDIDELRKLMKYSTKKGIPVYGIAEKPKNWINGVFNTDKPLSVLTGELDKSFKRITPDLYTGIRAKFKQAIYTNVTCLDPEKFSRIKSEVCGKNDNQNLCNFFTPVIEMDNHVLVYGKLKMELETKEHVRGQTLEGVKTNIKVISCKQDPTKTEGTEITYKRMDDSDELAVYEVYSHGNSIAIIEALPIKDKAFKHHFTDKNLGTKTYLQTIPHTETPDSGEFECTLVIVNSTSVVFGSHVREGVIPADNDSNWLTTVKNKMSSSIKNLVKVYLYYPLYAAFLTLLAIISLFIKC